MVICSKATVDPTNISWQNQWLVSSVFGVDSEMSKRTQGHEFLLRDLKIVDR